MRHTLDISFLVFAVLPAIAASQARINIVPQPNSTVLREGTFLLSHSTVIACTDNVGDLGDYLADQIRLFTLLKLSRAVSPAGRENALSLTVDSTLDSPSPEGYTIEVSSDRIALRGRTNVGLFRGIQTLLQLIPLPGSTKGGGFPIPSCRIKDFPRFGWRGLNLDCVRHFMTKEFVKKYIDLLAYYKFNVFHWHLTDDQGWRVEIKTYPKLTQVGAWRKEADGTTYGGFYSQDDIREIVSYARSRFITVVPEIEMPGHCTASLASYPENACIGGPFEVGIRWGVYKDIYCPGKESTFTFLENILKEVMDLFPSRYIHIGGDEVPKDEWRESDLCQKLMKEKGLKNEEELQSYFIRRIQGYLRSHGREIVGWDEILEGNGPDSGAVVQSWRGVDGAMQASKAGLKTIVSPGDYTYLSQDPDRLSIDSVYSFDPVPGGLRVDQQKLVVGTEASLWTETAPQETADGKLFPRLLAMAENAWTLPANKNLAGFHARLDRQYDRLAYLGVDYGLEMRGIVFQSRYDRSAGQFIVDLDAAQPGIRIRYTTGDSITLTNSLLYEAPVTVKGTSPLTAQAEMKGRLVGNPIHLSFIADEALGAQVTVSGQYAARYSAGGIRALVDGIRGTLDFRDGLWQGYEGIDFNATVDLGEAKAIARIGAGFYQNAGSWIFMPDSVEYFLSTDGEHFVKAGVVRNDVPQRDPDPLSRDFVLTFDTKEARYFRIVAKNIGVCPPWHPGAGGKAWLFIDEVFAD